MILLYPIVALSMAVSLLPWIYLSMFVTEKKEIKKKFKEATIREEDVAIIDVISKEAVRLFKNSNVIEFGKK